MMDGKESLKGAVTFRGMLNFIFLYVRLGMGPKIESCPAEAGLQAHGGHGSKVRYALFRSQKKEAMEAEIL